MSVPPDGSRALIGSAVRTPDGGRCRYRIERIESHEGAWEAAATYDDQTGTWSSARFVHDAWDPAGERWLSYSLRTQGYVVHEADREVPLTTSPTTSESAVEAAWMPRAGQGEAYAITRDGVIYHLTAGRAEAVLRLKTGKVQWQLTSVLGDTVYAIAAHQVVQADPATRKIQARPLPPAVGDQERIAAVIAMASERGARLVLAYASRPLLPVVDAPGSSRILCLDYPGMRVSEIGRAPSHAPLLAATKGRLWVAWTDRQHTWTLRVITIRE